MLSKEDPKLVQFDSDLVKDLSLFSTKGTPKLQDPRRFRCVTVTMCHNHNPLSPPQRHIYQSGAMPVLSKVLVSPHTVGQADHGQFWCHLVTQDREDLILAMGIDHSALFTATFLPSDAFICPQQ
jgi:hypothetical protein